MTRQLQARDDAPIGTGTDYYVEACRDVENHPRVSAQYDDYESGIEHDRARFGATQFRHDDRRWQCGGEYFDTETERVYELDAVVRKSSWCDTGDAEDGTLKFQFVSKDEYREIEYDPATAKCNDGRPDPTDRFLEFYNVPYSPK